jgi:hypothetical protein
MEKRRNSAVKGAAFPRDEKEFSVAIACESSLMRDLASKNASANFGDGENVPPKSYEPFSS